MQPWTKSFVPRLSAAVSPRSLASSRQCSSFVWNSSGCSRMAQARRSGPGGTARQFSAKATDGNAANATSVASVFIVSCPDIRVIPCSPATREHDPETSGLQPFDDRMPRLSLLTRRPAAKIGGREHRKTHRVERHPKGGGDTPNHVRLVCLQYSRPVTRRSDHVMRCEGRLRSASIWSHDATLRFSQRRAACAFR
jgi:hypothetical protein